MAAGLPGRRRQRSFVVNSLNTSDMMLRFNIPHNPDIVRHDCTTERRGDWVIFRCPDCPDFERRFNYMTGQLSESPSIAPHIQHDGTYFPAGLRGLEVTTMN